MNHNNNNYTVFEAIVATIITIVTAMVENIIPFTIHTASAVLTGIIVLTVNHHYKKWLDKKRKNESN